MALQTGVVDAADLSPDLVISGQFTNAITHYSRIGTHQLPSLFIMSKARFDSFPPNIRALVLDAGREASVAASEEQRRSQAAGLEQMRAAGIVITSPDLSTFREAGRKAWPAILANVPKADEYLAELKVAQKGK